MAPTTAFAPMASHATLRLSSTSATEFIDLTHRIEAAVDASGVRTGLVVVQARHTTTAVVVNEHEPLLLRDMVERLERLVPADDTYRHDDALARTANVIAGERRNGHAHCRALLLSPSVVLVVADGRLQLGRWQRVFLLDLDGPQDRDVAVVVTGACDR